MYRPRVDAVATYHDFMFAVDTLDRVACKHEEKRHVRGDTLGCRPSGYGAIGDGGGQYSN